MSRTVREQWGELHKFMSRVKAKYPTSQCFLKQEKLYVDNRMFVWNLEEGRVTEQMVVTIPATPGNVFPGLNVQSKYGKQAEAIMVTLAWPADSP